MLGVVFTGNGGLDIREFADPQPGAGQVVVEMKSSGLCGSDLRPYRSSADELGPRAGIISGHEPCGVVVEVGAGVRNARVGDRVMVHHYSGCQRCEHCQTGWTQLCQTEYQKVYGSHAHGGNADYELIEDYMCVPMPDGLSYEEGAAIACGTGTAYQALRRLDVSGRDALGGVRAGSGRTQWYVLGGAYGRAGDSGGSGGGTAGAGGSGGRLAYDRSDAGRSGERDI